jgi:DNA-binding CsgD family transcriptional regulator
VVAGDRGHGTVRRAPNGNGPVKLELSEAEERALEALIDSATQVEAAKRLGIATQTLKNTLADARRRNGCRSNIDLVYRLALEE